MLLLLHSIHLDLKTHYIHYIRLTLNYPIYLQPTFKKVSFLKILLAQIKFEQELRFN